MLTATVAPFGHPHGSNPARFALIAPFAKDPDRWTQLPWTNYYEIGSRYRATTSEDLFRHRIVGHNNDDQVLLKTFRDVLSAYRTHPEAKSLGANGRLCTRQTRGLLQRRPVHAAATHSIGKEAISSRRSWAAS